VEDCILAQIEEVKAIEQIVKQHHRAAAKSRQEGFEAKDEEARNLKVSLTEYKSGSTALHFGSKIKAARNEKQSGVRKFTNQVNPQSP
jgi:hypothetical protein